MAIGSEGLADSIIARLGDIKGNSPQEFGILEENLAPTLVYDVTNHLFDRPVLRQPTWVTARGKDSIHGLIGPNGQTLPIGVLWEDDEPVLMRHGDTGYSRLENQYVYGGIFPVTEKCAGKVVAVRQLVADEFQITRLLCVQIPPASFEGYFLGNELVSGVQRMSGPIRDWQTRYKSSDSPLLQELKQHARRIR